MALTILYEIIYYNTRGKFFWVYTHSQLAVKELQRWFLQSDHPVSTPPPYEREVPIPNLDSPLTVLGVAENHGSRKGIPPHVREQLESEERFKQLSFAAIEPFPEEEREWDGDEAAPRVLQNAAQWPRGRGCRVRFNPRKLEKPEEMAVEPTPTEEGTKEQPAPEETVQCIGEGTTPERANSAFQRLGRRPSPHRQWWSPDRFTDRRECPSRGVLFGGIRPVPLDGRDPPRDACFNCRRGGHARFNCREPPSLFCYNCGRRGTTLRACPRCGEAHLDYLREQGRAANHQGRSRSAAQPAASGTPRRGPPTSLLTPPPSPPISRRDVPVVLRATPAEASGSITPPTPAGGGVPAPTTTKSSLLEYFSQIQHLPVDLQETLLRAFLAQ